MAHEVVRRQLRVGNPEGLHVRPVANLVRLASTYGCDIKLILGGRKLDAKSMMDLLTVAAPQGTELVLEAVGSDAQAAADAIVKLFAEQLCEGSDVQA